MPFDGYPDEVSKSQYKRVKRRWGTLNRQFQGQGWLEHYQQLANAMMPRKGRYLRSSDVTASDASDAGAQINSAVLNSSAIVAARTLTAGLTSGITNPGRPWFALEFPLMPNLDKDDESAKWLHHVTEVMREIFSQAGFYRIASMLYDELGVFGTAACGIEEDYDNVVLFTPLTVGEYRIATDAKGQVNTLYRHFPFTTYQLVQKFGKDACSRKVREAYSRKEYDGVHIVLHAVEPNPEFDPFKRSNRAKPFVSYYCERDVPDDEHRPLKVGYYSYFPFLVPRWHITGNDPYGRSCGMEALPDTRSLNKYELRDAQMLDRGTTPSMQGPPSLLNSRKSLLPGSYTAVSDPTGKRMQPVYVPDPQWKMMNENKIARLEKSIARAFFADLFLQMLSSDRREMTAEEVRERSGEKLLLLSPVLQQIEGDLLMPLIRMTYMLAMQAGILRDPPDAIRGHPMQVKFISVLYQAQRAAEITGIERVLAFAGTLQAVDPGIFDNIDSDQSLRLYREYLGANPMILRNWDVVQQRRTKREDEQRRQQMMEQTPEMVKAAAALGNVDVGGGQTAAGMMLNGGAGGAA